MLSVLTINTSTPSFIMLGRSTPLLRRTASALPTASTSTAPSARLLHHTPSLRNTSPTPKKPSIASISEIRRLIPGTSMLKAREALYATQHPSTGDDDVQSALAWLEEDRRKSGAKKAEKVADRTNNEGLVGICLLSDGLPAGTEVVEGVLGGAHAAAPQGALVELNCETDFVARNEVFVQLVNDVSHTAALFPTLAGVPPVSTSSSLSDLPLEAFLDFPLMPANPTPAAGAGGKLRTVRSAIIDVVARLGEKVTLCRASTILLPPRGANVGAALPAKTIASAFAHGGGVAAPAQQQRPGQMMAAGKVVSLLLTRVQPPAAVASGSSSALTATRGAVAPLRALTRSLARQAAGMETASIRAAAADAADAAAVSGAVPLYSQPFAMLLSAAGVQRSSEEESVQSVLARWWKGEGEGEAEAQTASAEEAGSVDVVDMRRWKVGEVAPTEAASTTAEAA